MKLVLLCSLLVLLSACSSVSDDDLVARFNRQRDDFARLARMAEADADIKRLTKSSVNSGNAEIREPRVAEYRKLLRKLEIDDGMLRRFGYGDAVFFITDSWGLTSGGTMKGYVFSRSERSPVVDKIVESEYSSRGMVFRKIEENWYVFFSIEG